MTPAEIEAEAERLFVAWASTLALPADWKLPGEVTRAAWLTVAETSLRARGDVRRERDEARAMLTKADETIDACEDAHDRSTFSSWEVAGKRVREYREARQSDQAKQNAERTDMSEKPFPMPGTAWHVRGAEGLHVVTALRWFCGQVQAEFGARGSCAGVEHMMTLDAWECVEPAGDRWPLRTEGT